jgi:hypothetical protein
MNQQENNNEIDRVAYEERSTLRHHRKPNSSGRFFYLRNILNGVFMVLAIIGVLIYCFNDQFIGVIIIGGGMLVKMAEFCIRFIDK